jgi:hypothetical protein
MRYLFLALLLAGCSAQEHHVHISAAIDRYDHNRTTMLKSELLNGAQPFKVPETTYTPMGHELLRKISVVGVENSADQLPDVLLMPIYSGIRLPLSDQKQLAESSDYSDLIDYLADGPRARAGVSVPDLAGDRKAAEKQFYEILRFLGDRSSLCKDQPTMLAWAKKRGYAATLDVTDARYALSAFESVVALRQAGFWFVLYKLPDRDQTDGCDPYSRLVVVPDAPRGSNQKQAEKQPAAERS